MLVFPRVSQNHGVPEGRTANNDNGGSLQLPQHNFKEGVEFQG